MAIIVWMVAFLLERYMAVNRIDELNIDDQKISYKEYFGEMEISEKEKKDRIQLAEELEEAFLLLFAMMLQEDEDVDSCYQYIDERYCQIATKYIGAKETPAYITEYAAYITDSIVETTAEHMDTDYYVSRDRAMLLSANEANSIGNYREQIEMIKNGYRYKEWRTMKDSRVRHSHVKVDSKKIGIFEHFDVGAAQMMFPRDTSLGAGAFPEEIVNCRCSLRYTKD